LRHAHQRTDNLRSKRDTALDATRAALARWLDEHPQPDLTASQVRQWRSPRRFAQLAIAWWSEPPEHGAEISRLLEGWRRQDRHLWEWEANERDQVTARVKDLWANVAAWLTDEASLIVLDDTDIRDMTRVPQAGNEDPRQARLARAQQRIASPGKLRACVRRAAQKRGLAVETLPAKGITSTHCGCGAALVGEPATQLVLWCPACGHGVDQDLNAAEHLLAAATALATARASGSTRINGEQTGQPA
jgi:transposase